MKNEVFRMERVTYKEDEVVKLDDFNLSVYAGEIMGMLPMDGHGKTQFLKLMQTNLPLYDGYVYYNGIKVNSWRESGKTRNRISVIQAGSSLVESMNVTDNIFVLRQGFRQEIIRTGLLYRQLIPFLKDIGMEIPVDAKVENLTFFERIMVELLRAVVAGHRLIVLDEIGALISYEELQKLQKILRKYTEKGFSFLYISPHFEEIIHFCDRAVLLSEGHIQKVIPGHEMEEVVYQVYPAEYDSMVRYYLESKKNKIRKKDELIQWNSFSSALDRNLKFSVYEGECLVIQALESSIMQELIRIITGDLVLKKNDVRMNGKNLDFIRDIGVAVIQELPTRTMIFPELDYMENLTIALSRRMPLASRRRRIKENIRREYSVILGDEVFDMYMEELSQRQKYQLVYTRIFLQAPRVVFCVSPFKGADVPHRMFIWKLLERFLEKGISVVILSLGLSDSLSLADRMLVLESGRDAKEIKSEDFSAIPEQVPWTHLYKSKH